MSYRGLTNWDYDYQDAFDQDTFELDHQDQYDYSYTDDDYQYNPYGNGNYQGGSRNKSFTSQPKAHNSNSRRSRGTRGNNRSISQVQKNQTMGSGFIEISPSSKTTTPTDNPLQLNPSMCPDGTNYVVNIVNINHEY